MARSLRPTTSATRPPIPASTSSKTRVMPRRVEARHRLQGQHDARQLAPGGDAGQGPQLLAGVGREQELRPLEARARSRSRRRRGVRGDSGSKRTSKRVLSMASSAELGLDLLLAARGAAARRRCESARAPLEVRAPPGRSRRSSSARSCSSGEPSASSSSRQRAPKASTSSTVAPYFFLRRSMSASRASISSSRPGLTCERLAVVAQEAGPGRRAGRARAARASTKGAKRGIDRAPAPRPAGRPGRGARATASSSS